MATLPSEERYRRQWGELSLADRRRIMRAVNAGRALEEPREAALAVVTAARQERFWRRSWLLAPLAALLFVGQGWIAVAVNAALALAAIGVLSWWRLRRVRRAAARNRAVVDGISAEQANAGTTGASPADRNQRDHTPRRPSRRGLPPDAKGVRPGAGEPRRSRRQRRNG